jgi:ribosomal protein L34E
VKRRFVVACAACQRPLMTVDRIRDAEIAALEDHLRRCGNSEPLGDAAPLSEIMRRIRVTVREGEAP